MSKPKRAKLASQKPASAQVKPLAPKPEDTAMPTGAEDEFQLDHASRMFLGSECNRFLSLYTESQASIQSVFNFYLTFVSAVVGVVILVFQSGGVNGDLGGAELSLAGILLFGGIVGTVYLSALAGRYARVSRYSLAVDELRRFIIESQNLTVPKLYETLLQHKPRALTGRYAMIYWLFPSGTYQMFIAIVNSLAFTGALAILLFITEQPLERIALGCFVVFMLTLTISNIYAKSVMNRFNARVNLHNTDDSPAWAARE